MQAILRTEIRRRGEGKSSGFRVRGHVVQSEKISRYVKRKGATEDTLLAQASPVPGEYRHYIEERTLLTLKFSNPIGC